MDNAKITEILLTLQMEDLNDADMLCEYAKEIEKCGDMPLAQAIANRAKTRLAQMTECDRSIKLVMQRQQSEMIEKGEAYDENAVYGSLYRKYVDKESEKIRKKLEAM